MQIEFDARNKKGAIIIGGERLEDGQASELGSEARTLIRLGVYKRVFDSMRWTANEIIMKKALDMEQVNYGKACLYTLDVLEKKLENIAKL